MRGQRLVHLAALFVGAAFGLGAGCDPGDGDPEDTPPGVSSEVCYTDADCAPNGCCGNGTNPTHVSEAPDCSGVRCTGGCPPDSIDCGRCIAICREARCAAACQ
ncbi:hypothetical protein P2318_26025 [Myxococcaceae bacterium GXIMD 01537]